MSAERTYIGIDLGGGRGKTTAVARLEANGKGSVVVAQVSTKMSTLRGRAAWCDQELIQYISTLGSKPVIGINAPLTQPACVRCTEAQCPGEQSCSVPAVVWLRESGAQLLEHSIACDRDRIAAVPASGASARVTEANAGGTRARLRPYMHRCAEVELHYGRGLLPQGAMGQACGPVAARASHLRRRLTSLGFELNNTLLEVSTRATVHALFGPDAARGYKRDADPWKTRARIVAGLDDLNFGTSSCFAREDVLRNDHCFDAVLSAYTVFLRDRDGWTMPQELAATEDGYVWTPPQ